MASFSDYPLSLTFHLLNGNVVDDMWESRTKDPLGRLSTRKWLRAATTLLVAVFGYLLVSTVPVYAVPGDTQTDSQTTQQTPGQTVDTPSTDEDDQTQTPAPPEAGTTSCKVDGVGWIVCSMSRWIAEGVDYLYGILTDFFIFTPLATSGETNSMYGLWGTVRNLANVAFIIAFLIIIYAQITGGFLMSNYTIKKMLPRVIVAAILVNTSYWICAIAIDISNILGVAVQDMFTGFRESIGPAARDFPKWTDVTSGILGGTGIVLGGGALLAATGGTIGGLAFLLLGALLPAIFAALVAVAVLAARQALITLFVIIAPLAFVAYLLPNTEEWFNRWRKLFMTMLFMFPAFSFIFGASQVAGVIVIQNAKDISVALLGLTIQVVPLFITPFLIKLSSGLLGTIAGMANNRSKGLFDRTGNWAKANRELHRQRGFRKRPDARPGWARPTDLAQRLNRRSLIREQMTAGYKAEADAKIASSRQGRRAYYQKRDAEMLQHQADANNQESYNIAAYGANGAAHTRRSALHHQAHMASGRAKLYEERATAGAERDFREEILATRGLRKMVVDTNEQTKRAELTQAVVQARADANWNNLSNTDAVIRNLKLDQHATAQAAKRAEEQWNTILANIGAMGGAAPNIRPGEVRLADAIRKTSEEISIEAYTKSNAETLIKTNLKDTILENTRVIAGKTVREYAGGIRGNEGAESVLAAAIAADRKEFGERASEQLELMKHFKLSGAERQQLAMGTDLDVVRGGVTVHTFKAGNEHARDAIIEEQLKAGSFDDIEKIIEASGVGGKTHDYRSTIADAIVKLGLDKKALYWGGKTIDDVGQGQYSATTKMATAAKFIRDGKVKDEILAVQDAKALETLFDTFTTPAATVGMTPAEVATFQTNYQAMREAAGRVLDSDIPLGLTESSRAVLEAHRS